ncbi:MAG: 23S rRNA (cytidine(2498)-2'-O)-methyltransferase RlmM [Proteobacteria bacterium]|nr:23S rRNA (cytidine(2498)-2'-O)-methyltransferase RlmM [Pseudomonadota bacterium]
MSPPSLPQKSHVILCRPGFSELLCSELATFHSIDGQVLGPACVGLKESTVVPPLKTMVFARQIMPNAILVKDLEPGKAAAEIVKRLQILAKRSNSPEGHWTIHSFSMDDDDALAAARKIAKAFRATLKKTDLEMDSNYLDPEIFASTARKNKDFVIQIFGSSKDQVYFNISSLSTGISIHEGGVQRMKRFHDAPSRSASKLSEAFLFMGKHPKQDDTGVDLGAAPGGWSMVLAFHGTHVIAIDHSDLDIQSKTHLAGSIRHLRENGLKYLPEKPVDWLVCDMVMNGSQTLEVLSNWISGNHMKDFVVNVKLPNNNSWPKAIEALKFCETHRQTGAWKFIGAKHLYHDRHEITLMGERA